MKKLLYLILFFNLLFSPFNKSEAAGMSGENNIYAGVNLGILWSQTYIIGYNAFQLKIESSGYPTEVSYYIKNQNTLVSVGFSLIGLSLHSRVGYEFDFFKLLNLRTELGGSVNPYAYFAPEVFFGGFVFF
jgi:hypothetical protein